MPNVPATSTKSHAPCANLDTRDRALPRYVATPVFRYTNEEIGVLTLFFAEFR
jgi:hypothetical protein